MRLLSQIFLYCLTYTVASIIIVLGVVFSAQAALGVFHG